MASASTQVEEVNSILDGGSLRVKGRVANAGTRAAGPAAVALGLVERRTGAATPVIGSVEIDGLLPGASTRFNATVVLPDAPAGRYTVTAEVNPGHRVAESDGTNNTARDEREHPLGPDLTITALSAVVSDAIVVSDAAVNRGTRASGACGISFFLSRNGVLDATDVSLGYRVVPPLAAGAESRADTRLPLPRGLSMGRYYLLGKVDSSGAVAESDETNNVALAPDPLDLRFTDLLPNTRRKWVSTFCRAYGEKSRRSGRSAARSTPVGRYARHSVFGVWPPDDRSNRR
jgi:hypothetical protein